MFPGAGLIQILINILILLLLVRAIFSWFPGMLYSEAGRFIVTATEWYLAPIRRVIPPAGGMDLSFLVGIILLYALSIFIGSGNIVLTLIAVIGYALVLCIILVLVRVFFSFFRMDPWHPFADKKFNKKNNPVEYARFIERHRQQILELLTNYGKIDMTNSFFEPH